MLLLNDEQWPIFIVKWVQEWINNYIYYTVLDFSKLPAELYYDALLSRRLCATSPSRDSHGFVLNCVCLTVLPLLSFVSILIP